MSDSSLIESFMIEMKKDIRAIFNEQKVQGERSIRIESDVKGMDGRVSNLESMAQSTNDRVKNLEINAEARHEVQKAKDKRIIKKTADIKSDTSDIKDTVNKWIAYGTAFGGVLIGLYQALQAIINQ